MLGDINASFRGFFGAVNGEIAEITLTYDALPFALAKRKLDKIHGVGKTKLLSGEAACNNVQITEWKGKDSKLLLAVISPELNKKGKAYTMLYLRSQKLYGEYKRRVDKAFADSESECRSQEW